MRDKSQYADEDDNYDYSPNDLARLQQRNPEKYRRVVESNLTGGDTIRDWEERNREYAQRHLRKQNED